MDYGIQPDVNSGKKQQQPTSKPHWRSFEMDRPCQIILTFSVLKR